MTYAFRCFHRPRTLGAPSTFLGTVLAEDCEDARAQAVSAWPGKCIDLISQIQWDALSKDERSMAEGTYYTPDQKIKCPKGTYATVDARTRSARCQLCGQPILFTRDAEAKWRRPPKFHKIAGDGGDSCLAQYRTAEALRRGQIRWDTRKKLRESSR